MSSKDAARAAVASFGPPGASEYLLLAGISLAWGTSYMFTKVAVEELPPVMLVALRLVIAAAVMLTVVLARRMRWPSARDLAAFGVVGLLSNAAPLTLIAISVSYVDSSVTAITMALVPLITACLAVFTGSYPSIRSVVGIALGLVGVFVLFGPQAFLSFGGGTRGLIAAVAAALIFSTSLFCGADGPARGPGDGDCPLAHIRDDMVCTAGDVSRWCPASVAKPCGNRIGSGARALEHSCQQSSDVRAAAPCRPPPSLPTTTSSSLWSR